MIAQALELAYPNYAMIAAVIVTDVSSAETRQLGLRRMVATVVGSLCGALLSPVLSSDPGSVAFGILAAMLVCNLIHANGGAKVAGYICGIVLLTHGHENWTYAFYRFVETALGIGVAWGISLVPSLIPIEDGDAPLSATARSGAVTRRAGLSSGRPAGTGRLRSSRNAGAAPRTAAP